MARTKSEKKSEKRDAGEPKARRRFTEEFKAEAVQMLLDGHSAASICERLGLSGPNVLYRWKRDLVRRGGSAAVGLEARGRELEAELRRVERERDILKKALSIFGRDG
jgi:transposase